MFTLFKSFHTISFLYFIDIFFLIYFLIVIRIIIYVIKSFHFIDYYDYLVVFIILKIKFKSEKKMCNLVFFSY